VAVSAIKLTLILTGSTASKTTAPVGVALGATAPVGVAASEIEAIIGMLPI
jgi:hypothetical protein